MLSINLRSAAYPLAPLLRENGRSLRQGSARDLPVLLLVTVYAVAVGSLAAGDVSRIAADLPRTFLDFCFYALASAFVVQAGLCFFVTRPKSPIRTLAGFAALALPEGRAGRWLPFLLALALLTASFSVFKPSIAAHAGGFDWDPVLLRINRTVHFGRLPWEILQPLFGHPWITKILDVNYALWFGVMWVFAIGTAAFCRDEAHRQRSLLSFALIWIVAGSGLAASFASAGPCYYGPVVPGPDPFAGLMSYLGQVHDSIGLIAVDTQRLLWLDHLGGRPSLGISAMPSMHNAVAALMVLSGWRHGIWLRLALLAHAVLVFLGSILLGWHYAIDVYVAWAATAAIWMLVRPFAHWWAGRCEKALPIVLPALEYA